jgi:hypothetical protein
VIAFLPWVPQYRDYGESQEQKQRSYRKISGNGPSAVNYFHKPRLIPVTPVTVPYLLSLLRNKCFVQSIKICWGSVPQGTHKWSEKKKKSGIVIYHCPIHCLSNTRSVNVSCILAATWSRRSPKYRHEPLQSEISHGWKLVTNADPEKKESATVGEITCTYMTIQLERVTWPWAFLGTGT